MQNVKVDASVPDGSGSTAQSTTRIASENTEEGRGHGLAVICWLLEQRWPMLIGMDVALATFVTLLLRGGGPTFAIAFFAIPLVGILVPATMIVFGSRREDEAGDWEKFVTFRDAADAKKWAGKKIPMEVAYEAYLSERLDFQGDVYETLLRRNKLFRFAFTWGDLKFFLLQFLRQNLGHDLRSDRDLIVPNYDRGNDFYGWFLGESMIYTSGIFRDPSETLEAAQRRKLETVCSYVQMKAGDRHLDIGCGWGTLLVHAAREHGTRSTGITLAKEQAAFANGQAAAAGVSDRVRVIVDDYRKLPMEQYDKITCLEMAEHVGIRNFQKFLLQVRAMLKDDGIFYLQIAGLRRSWQYEDLVWGLFMGKYIFPGADASCPLGFVTSQVERAGFEVHRVENCGTHYATTIEKWYANWLGNRDKVVEKYGERWFRLWSLFLGWSAIIGAQGSSTVFMVTLTKNAKNDRASVSADEVGTTTIGRRDLFIGANPIATQQ